MDVATKLYDLHVHSVRSDGVYSSLQLLEMARRSGLAGIAITDHDVLPDSSTRQTCGSPIHVIAGVELSAMFNGRGLHVLGYGFEPGRPELLSVCEMLQSGRQQRWHAMCEAIERLGVRLDRQRAQSIGQSASPGRAQLAREIVHAGAASSVREAFARYLNKLDATTSWQRVSLVDAITAIHAASGAAVLAHPPSHLTADEWKDLVHFGLDGVETMSPSISPKQRRKMEDLAREYRLVRTAGSDFHGADWPNYLGRFTNNHEQVAALLGRAAAAA